jgi:hypothetical protein
MPTRNLVTSDRFVNEFLAWVLERYGPASPAAEEGEAAEFAVSLRAEQVAALRLAAERRGTTPAAILREVVDAWLVEQYAGRGS